MTNVIDTLAASVKRDDIPEFRAGDTLKVHVKVVEGLGCKAIRVHKQEEIAPAIKQAEAWMAEFRVPVVIEIILERVTNIAMGTEIDAINEFNDVLDVK